MPVPDTRNARIAIAKNWTFIDVEVREKSVRVWRDEKGVQQRELPDWVGTLVGVAELMRELGDEWYLGRDIERWLCYRGEDCEPNEGFWSPDDRPGDCVGDAWLSEFGKERTRG